MLSIIRDNTGYKTLVSVFTADILMLSVNSYMFCYGFP